MICQVCDERPAVKAAVYNGKYYARLCAVCYTFLTSGQGPSSGQASYNRQRDLEDHLADIQQPYVGDQPNPDFIKAYPAKAKTMFTTEELRRYGG